MVAATANIANVAMAMMITLILVFLTSLLPTTISFVLFATRVWLLVWLVSRASDCIVPGVWVGAGTGVVVEETGGVGIFTPEVVASKTAPLDGLSPTKESMGEPFGLSTRGSWEKSGSTLLLSIKPF